MPQDSAAVRALKTALAQAATPTEKADVATKLARAQHQQGIERGRRRRAKAAKPKPAVQPINDDDEEFDFPYPSPPLTRTPQAPPAAALPATPPEPAEDVPEEEAPQPTGFSRTLDVMEFPTEEATYPTARFHNDISYTDPLAHLGTKCVESDEFIGGRFASDVAAEVEDAEAARWSEWEKIWK